MYIHTQCYLFNLALYTEIVTTATTAKREIVIAITIPTVAPLLSTDESWRTGDVVPSSWEGVVVADATRKIEAASASVVCSTFEMLLFRKFSTLITAVRIACDHNIIKSVMVSKIYR